jgi:hypothetical protein
VFEGEKERHRFEAEVSLLHTARLSFDVLRCCSELPQSSSDRSQLGFRYESEIPAFFLRSPLLRLVESRSGRDPALSALQTLKMTSDELSAIRGGRGRRRLVLELGSLPSSRPNLTIHQR